MMEPTKGEATLVLALSVCLDVRIIEPVGNSYHTAITFSINIPILKKLLL